MTNTVICGLAILRPLSNNHQSASFIFFKIQYFINSSRTLCIFIIFTSILTPNSSETHPSTSQPLTTWCHFKNNPLSPIFSIYTHRCQATETQLVGPIRATPLKEKRKLNLPPKSHQWSIAPRLGWGSRALPPLHWNVSTTPAVSTVISGSPLSSYLFYKAPLLTTATLQKKISS